MLKIVYCIVLNIGILFFVHGALAKDIVPGLARENMPIKVEYKKSLHIELSSKGINRISFWPLRVEKLICDLSNFTSNVPENGTDIFLTSKVPAGTSLNASVILSTGEPIDMHIKVVEAKEPKYIQLDFSNLHDDPEGSLKKEASLMINAMKNNFVGKYYVRSVKYPKLLFETKEYRVKQRANYQYEGLIGAILEIENKKSKSITIDPKSIVARFEGMQAFAFEGEVIAPKYKMKGYVVFKSGEGA